VVTRDAVTSAQITTTAGSASSGSFSSTKAAQEKNVEGLLTICDPVLGAQNVKNRAAYRQHNLPYVGWG
jgi:hypothetical protein